MSQVAALIRHELWQRRTGIIWWSIGVAALVGMDMLLYSSIKDQAAELDQALKNMPPAIMALFADGADFLSPAGFLSGRIYYLLLPLLFSIFAIRLGATLIGSEEKHGTLELILARPVSRTKLLISKFVAGALTLSILGVVALITALVCLKPSGLTGISYSAIAITTLQAVLLASLFGMLAFTLIALGGKARGAASGVAALFAFGSYIIASLESLIDWLHTPALLMPYYYYQPAKILSGASHEPKQLIAFTGLILMLLVVSWFGFRRRDIG
ncbi:MAG TPA: ABC transporter permease subunit [Candidatus Saccharimonadales bacterium]|nr:ABC transporter permease subunit [Candidatus Saccharimonadales bacterium]